MSNQIVTVTVSQLIAPAPSTLQKTGALISQGATTLTANTYSLLTEYADLAPLLTAANPVVSMVLSMGTVTVTLTNPHGIPTGKTVGGVISGVLPTDYNGTFDVTSTGTDTFTYPLAGSPGAVTQQGSFILESQQELIAMATTFFAQGNTQSIYVLELGAGTAADGVTSLTTYMADPTLRFYSYGLPTGWADESTAITMARNNDALTAKVYFFVRATLSNYANWTGIKSAFVVLQTPTAPITEFDATAPQYVTLNYAPSQTNMVTPTSFSYLVGVTPYVLTGPQQTAVKAAFANSVTTGAEGGISNTIIKWGTTADGRDFTYWYSVDWMQINIALALANEIINGSNTPQNPLYYDQNGINRLQARAQAVVNQGVSYGLVNGNPVVTAIPFSTYTANNPSDYANGIYNGLALTYTPNRGFTSITFALTISDIPTG